ncbi:MAG: nuclear transport factor 2 family protein [Actinobacteria bacterium]|nr:nuclear transport factor 2 family protein [Actinomycetota bacterium]
MSAEQEVREALERLVAAFGEGRLDDYFACFHPQSSFVFHTSERRLGSRAEYRKEWDRWVAEDGFEILGCRTSDTHVQVWGEVGVITHSVQTRQSAGGEASTVRERETIVFAKQPDGRWLAVHEHLSPAPEAEAGASASE